MTSIVVVGGGIAGLTCAWRLSRLPGYEVEVLEAEATPGGRMRSERHGEFVLDRGVPTLGSGQSQVHELARRLGLGNALHRLEAPPLATLRGSRFELQSLSGVRSLAESSHLSLTSRARLLGLGVALRRRRDRLDPSRPEAALAFDRESLIDALLRRAGPEASEAVLPLLASRYGAEVEGSSEAFLWLALRWWEENPHEDALEGGLGRLCDALADDLHVRQSCLATRVESHGHGVRVHYRVGEREGSVVADAAVLAVPGSRVTGLCPKLTPAERGFFESVRYGRALVAHALYQRSPGRLPLHIALPRARGFGISSIHAAHLKPGAAPPGAGLLSVSLTGAAALRHQDLSDGEVAALVRDNLARTPLGEHSPDTIVVHRFREHLPQHQPGHLHRLHAFRMRGDRSQRLAFCGDSLAGPWCDGALASGMQAAVELVRQLEGD